ncbi:MAG: stage II sporulation protein M, partial [Dehalococcoidales bacterium]
MSYRGWILVAVGLFAIGMTLGLAMPDDAVELFAGDLTALEELAEILGPFEFSTAAFIFLKNVSALLFSFIFSPLLCLVPIIALIANGGLLSFVSVIVIEQESVGLLLAGLLPHGIFELPALIIGEAAALSFGSMAIIALISKKRRSQLSPNLKRNLKYLALAFALLLPAAIIETYITPLLL